LFCFVVFNDDVAIQFDVNVNIVSRKSVGVVDEMKEMVIKLVM